MVGVVAHLVDRRENAPPIRGDRSGVSRMARRAIVSQRGPGGERPIGMKMTAFELFKAPPCWLFLKVSTDSGTCGLGRADRREFGPFALRACLQVDACTPNTVIQEQSLDIHYRGRGPARLPRRPASRRLS